MSVTINSGVEATGSWESSLTNPPFILNTPATATVAGTIPISSVIGLTTALDAKLNDTLGPVGTTNVFTNGTDINLLAGTAAYGLTTIDLQTLADTNASSTELNHLVGVTGPIQTQIDAAYSDSDFTAADQMVVSTGVGAATVATISDVLNGTVGVGYEFSSLMAPTADLDFNNQFGINVLDPVNPQDIATKNYVDTVVVSGSGFLPLAGGVMTGSIDMDSFSIVLDADGDTSLSAAVDDTVQLDVAGVPYVWTATGFDMASQLITNVLDPVNPQDAATLNSVTNAITAASASYLLLDGSSTMAGNLDMGTTFRIVNVADPINPQDAVTLSAMTTAIATATGGGGTVFLADGSVSMTGNADFGANNITNVADPTTGDHVGDRDYNDARYLQVANDLSDVANPTTARAALGLATVAATGAYSDLTGAPTVPTDLDSLTDVSTGSPGLTEDGYVVTWNNAGSAYNLLPAPVVSAFGRTGTVVGALGDYTAAQITNVAAGNILAVNVQDAINELDAEKVAVDGSSSMTGSLDMNGNQIINLSADLDFGDHSFTSNTLTSTLSGGGYLINASNVPTAATPTYAFAGDIDTGMWLDAGSLAITVGGANQMVVGVAEVSMEGNQVKNVVDPTDAQDAVTLNYLEALGTQRILGSATGIDLLATGPNTIYTLDAGVRHVITKVILIATSYNPGATPSDPVVSLGTVGGGSNDIVNTVTASWGTGGAADQAVYIEPYQGASTPNAANTISLLVDTAAAGTFSALTVDVYVMGFEL